jgi:uncharacterized membrane protein/glutaredoxin
MLNITLYTRKGCHLCEDVKAHLAELQKQFPHKLVEIDIDKDPKLAEKMGEQIPVVEIGPFVRQAPITKQDLIVSLGAAQDRMRQLDKIGHPAHEARKKRNNTLTRADKISWWFSKRYIWVFNIAVFIYVGLPFLAPVLMSAGITGPARVIYSAYGFVCHQLAYRSWFLFGDQAAYPRAAANVDGYITYGEATGLSELDNATALWNARSYVGDDQVGYKVAYCERDVAIYAAILLFGVVFALTGRRIRSIPWYVWIGVGMIPIGLDGFSQVFSQMNLPIFNLIPYRESTPFLRTLTGGLFGLMTAWFGYPLVEETMRDTRRALTVKFKRLGVKLD